MHDDGCRASAGSGTVVVGSVWRAPLVYPQEFPGHLTPTRVDRPVSANPTHPARIFVDAPAAKLVFPLLQSGGRFEMNAQTRGFGELADGGEARIVLSGERFAEPFPAHPRAPGPLPAMRRRAVHGFPCSMGPIPGPVRESPASTGTLATRPETYASILGEARGTFSCAGPGARTGRRPILRRRLRRPV